MKKWIAGLAVGVILAVSIPLIAQTVPMRRLARGFIIRGNSSNVGRPYDANDSSKILVGDGTDLNSVAVSGDVSALSTAGAFTVDNITVGSDAAGDINYKTAAATSARLAIGAGARKLMVDTDSSTIAWSTGKEVDAYLTGMTTADDPSGWQIDATAADGTTGALNFMGLPGGTILGYYPLGAGQTITIPVGQTGGIDIGGDQADNEGFEIFSNYLEASGSIPLSVGFDPAFYFNVEINVANVSGVDSLFIGFRKLEAHNADVEAYDTYCGIGWNTSAATAAIKIRDELNGGGVTNTDTTDTIADGTDLEVKILVSAAGACTYQHDADVPGTLEAPDATHALTLDDGDQVIPVIWFLNHNAGGLGGVFNVKKWEVGYQ